MTRAERRFALDTGLAIAGFAAVLALVIALIDGVELARLLAEGGLGFEEWLGQLAGRLPGRVVAALPIAAALGAARTVAVWRRTGRVIAVTASGRSPVRLAVAATVAAAVVATGVAVAREAVAPVAVRALAGEGRWVVLDGPVPADAGDAVLHVRAATLVGGLAEDVSLAWVANGRLVGAGQVARARWDGATWALEGASGRVWPDEAAVVPVQVGLPPLDVWRAATAGDGVDAPASRLWALAPSPARTTWLLERGLTPLGTAGVAGLAVALMVAGGRLGTAWVLAAAVVWRLGQSGALAVCARGQWPVVVGAWGPVILLAITIAVAWRWLDRDVRAASG